MDGQIISAAQCAELLTQLQTARTFPARPTARGCAQLIPPPGTGPPADSTDTSAPATAPADTWAAPAKPPTPTSTTTTVLTEPGLIEWRRIQTAATAIRPPAVDPPGSVGVGTPVASVAGGRLVVLEEQPTDREHDRGEADDDQPDVIEGKSAAQEGSGRS